MKVSTIIAASHLLFDAAAFSPSLHCTKYPSSLLKGTSRPDVSEMISEAIRITEQNGVSSVDAKLAWDAIEEMDANDNSAAFSTGEMEHLPDRLPHETEYIMLVNNLSILMQETGSKLSQMKQLASKLKELELEDCKVTKLGKMQEPFAKALAEAKAATDLFGVDSEESVEAWNDLKRISNGKDDGISSNHESYRYNAASLSPHHYYSAVVDLATLKSALEGLGMIEHLGRLLMIEKNRIDSLEELSP